MKLLLLANPASSHTIKWANSLSRKGIDVYLFGLNGLDKNSFDEKIKIETLYLPNIFQSNQDGAFSKIIYLAALRRIKSLIKKIKPDILHAHYASSYGVLGALTGFHPYVISVWGSDIYIMPEKNFFNRKLIEFSLSKANAICSTSFAMAEQTKKFSSKKIEVIPFGIDTGKFKPVKVDSLFHEKSIVIGTVKTLEMKYGIEYLIKVFKLVKEKLTMVPLKLLIVGGGAKENQFKKLVKDLSIDADTIFTGYINHEEIPKYHNMIDIFVSLSDTESFGVSALEASACGKPVVVSDADGFKEVVKDNHTGIIVRRGDVEAASKAIITLIENADLRFKLGSGGREHVIQNYDWNKNVDEMINVYKKLLLS